MRRVMILVVTAMMVMGLLVSLGYSQEAEPEGTSEDDLDKLLTAPPKKPETPAEDAAKEVAPPPPAPAQAFPEDPHKLRVTVKMKSGATITGRVKHFLKAVNQVDHLSEPEWTLADGVTVEFEYSEFSVSWDKLHSIAFNGSYQENGEISCYEDSDKSPERMECIMLNQYHVFTKEKGPKAPHVVVDGEMFRLVVDTGKGLVNVDSHLGRFKITNQRDESRRMEDMEKELREVYRDAVLNITFN